MDGVLVVYKEKGYTSHDVVGRLRHILGMKRIGHMGTLDPDAEGVLPVCLGRATRLADLLSTGTKTYRTTLLLGVTTDTQDVSGRVLEKKPVQLTEEALRSCIFSFLGTQAQLTPMYSARKVGGQKLMDLARKGQEVERPTKEIEIETIEILSVKLPRVEMRIRCSKGTYIRTICHDIGQALGCGGAMETLLREEASGFTLKDSLRLSHIDALALTGRLEHHVLSLETIAARYPAFICKEESTRLVSNGNPLQLKNGSFQKEIHKNELCSVYLQDGSLMGLYRYLGSKNGLKPAVMLLPDPNEKPRIHTPVPSVVSIGKFDGFHVGHQKILEIMKEKAREQKLRTVLFSFSQSPQALLAGGKSDTILSEREKKFLARELGVDQLAEYPFTDEIRTTTAEDFLEHILLEKLGMKEIVVGPDCAFGYERRGNAEFLREAERNHEFHLTVVEKVRNHDEIISSTLVRKLLAAGEMEQVEELLGYPYFVLERVIHGNHIGHELGFPTINQRIPDNKVIPPYGVYASEAVVDGTCYQAMSNLGVKPTVTGTNRLGLETHIFDLDQDLYGREIKVSLKHFVRREVRFQDLEALERQLENDRANVAAWFSQFDLMHFFC